MKYYLYDNIKKYIMNRTEKKKIRHKEYLNVDLKYNLLHIYQCLLYHKH